MGVVHGVCEGCRYTAVLVAEYLSASCTSECSVSVDGFPGGGPDAMSARLDEMGAAGAVSAKEVSCEDMRSALSTHVNNEAGVT